MSQVPIELSPPTPTREWGGGDFSIDSISIIKRKANSNIEQQKCKGHEKRDRLIISKMDFRNQISQRNKSFTY